MAVMVSVGPGEGETIGNGGSVWLWVQPLRIKLNRTSKINFFIKATIADFIFGFNYEFPPIGWDAGFMPGKILNGFWESFSSSPCVPLPG